MRRGFASSLFPCRLRSNSVLCQNPVMPKAGKPKSESTRTSPSSFFLPYTKDGEKAPTGKSKTGKDSHLYTDDNPTTTLKGTGFKDAATAKNTIELVSQRSLLYQFQTINTMYYRAKHHPHSASNLNMQAAMDVFEHWLKHTYPEGERRSAKLSASEVERRG